MRPRQWRGIRNIGGFIIELDPRDGLYHVIQRPRARTRIRKAPGRWQVLTAGIPTEVGAYRTLHGAAKAARRIKQGGLIPKSERQHRRRHAWVRLAA